MIEDQLETLVAAAGRDRPVLIAGPTASGKSALGLALAEAAGGVIVNADALQVFSNWRILTARPTPQDEATVGHLLYGHIGRDQVYSVGQWLRDLKPILRAHRAGTGPRPIILGGTGLYFTALTEGLTDIPPTPPAIREHGNALRSAEGLGPMLAELDKTTRAQIDPLNPMRVQRAWEVLRSTGRSLAEWQAETGPPLLPLEHTAAFIIEVTRERLAHRIETRFATMLGAGLLGEVSDEAHHWRKDASSSKAIGAKEMIAHHRGEMTLEQAGAAVVTLTRQYARRQRKWFRVRMADWQRLYIG